MKYDVHIYPIVRVKVFGVEADSQVEAIKKAETVFDFDQLLNHYYSDVEVEYADDIDGFLVDEQGDERHERSQFYDKEYRPR